MNERVWADVDSFFNERFGGSDSALRAALEESRAAGLPAIQVSAMQGKLLMLLARSIGARHILEIGTLGGYSTIWLARALPGDGRLMSCEVNASYAEVARANVQRAGLGEQVEIRVGRASDTLATLAAERAASFDFVFIDADKASYSDYLTAALKLVRPGALIVADNVVRRGRLVDNANTDADTLGMRRFLAQLGSEPRLTATALQTVGQKGYDGFALALVTG